MITNPKKPKAQLKIKVRPRPLFTKIDLEKTTAPAAKVMLYSFRFRVAALSFAFWRRFRIVMEYREAVQIFEPLYALKIVREAETMRTNNFKQRWAEKMRAAGIIVVNV